MKSVWNRAPSSTKSLSLPAPVCVCLAQTSIKEAATLLTSVRCWVWWEYLDVNCAKHQLEAWMLFGLIVLKVPSLGGFSDGLVSLALLLPWSSTRCPTHQHLCDPVPTLLLAGVRKGMSKPQVHLWSLGFKSKLVNLHLFWCEGSRRKGKVEFFQYCHLSDAYPYL